MMRAGILMAAAVVLPCAAQPVGVAPWMTGADLVKLFDQSSAGEDSRPLTPLEQLHQYQAQAYMNGVHDATEGKEWCYSTKYNPHQDELWADALWGLRALPAEQLKRPAAELIVNIWRAKWPCRRKP
jgi:hypothetical protein